MGQEVGQAGTSLPHSRKPTLGYVYIYLSCHFVTLGWECLLASLHLISFIAKSSDKDNEGEKINDRTQNMENPLT